MKNRFNTYDLICTVVELQRLIGMRVNQVYDVDSKTYLIRLQQGENKVLLLIESGTRMHTTSFEWPKNMAPSGFSMKMRKHIRNKRLEKLTQLGLDRIVDLQFGSGDAAYHVIVELYDRGNIIFTDHEHVILNIFRPHTEGDDVKFMVREKYPSNRGKERPAPLTEQNLREIFANAKQDDSLKKILNPHLIYGPAIIEHMLLKVGLSPSCKLKNLNIDENITKFIEAFQIAEAIIDEAFTPNHKGYIIQKREKKAKDGDEFLSNQEFHPMIFEQNRNAPYLEFDSFDKAVDEFFSNMESQKIDMKGVQQEMAALKKLENVKKDHEKRISQLAKLQIEDTQKAELITRNQELVDDAILAIRQAIANQMPWSDIENLVKEATKCGDSVASVIKALKLNINHITLLLNDPYEEYDETGQVLFKPTLVDVDLDLSAHANAKKYYEKRRQAATKQKKTIESQDKAFKSAEKKTKLTLKEVKTSVTISKARKVYWFEKFYWFISSENYLGFETALDLVNDSKSFWAGATLNMAAVYGGILDNVIGGRDQQQNELIVKRYLKKNDIYVHAGIVGASSIVIKNPKSDPVPVKTLNEAGTMAMCYSTAWEAKVVTSAWWVYAHQVSKTAPTGEYLTTGSFMIRGKKNFLPQCHLIMGFTFMFKLEDSSLERHLNERKKKEIEESIPEENDDELQAIEELELEGESSDDNEPETTKGNVKSESNSKETSEPAYPDTEVLVVHKNVEKQCSIEVKIPSEKNTKKEEASVEEIDDDYVVYLGDDKPVIIKPPEVKKSDKQVTYNKQTTDKDDKKENSKPEQKQQSKQKRGQKSKLKKIKEKYKDQDEEEREIRMRILQGSPNKKEDKKRKKGKNTHVPVALKREPQPKKPPPPVQLLSVDESVQKPVVVEHEEEDDEEKETNEFTAAADIDMLDSLTGQPLPEDELLFAVPVVAPYNAIISYKYKVKLTPGTGKRGKTAKTALNVFLKDRTATTREKDLLKFVKDQDLARNFPGKVKLSAPQLMKYK